MPWFIERENADNAVHEQIIDLGLGVDELFKQINYLSDYEVVNATFSRLKVRHKSGRELLIRYALKTDDLKRALDFAVGANNS
jgi:hypothetical protein